MNIDVAEIREENRQFLMRHGFSFATTLPTRGPSELEVRPAAEIASRLAALNAVVLLVMAPDSVVSESTVNQMVLDCSLKEWCSLSDLEVLALPRREASSVYAGSIGWFQERMVPLGWVLGIEVELGDNVWTPEGDALATVTKRGPRNSADCRTFIEQAECRCAREIVQAEDLFYCLHNGVRCAVFGGGDTLPENFNPDFQGGIVQERRHALTWALSPDVHWDETDLST